jgi:poly [ADP-ribose] polymerase 10/14/15
MVQINAKSGYKRPILRQLVAKETSAPETRRGDIEQGLKTQKTLLSSDIPLPEELKDETLLVLSVGSIVQLSKQRPDGWAFGNVLLSEGDEAFSKVEGISTDAGWFPMNCVDMVGKDDLERLAKLMGPAGADTLAPPSVWTQLKDPSVAEMVEVKDATEKQRVVDWFGKTLMGKCPVVKVERIQNLSLWQSFAVKRQTIVSREGSSGASDLERVWLFHGTSIETVPKIVQQGFNRSFCGKNATMYGKGVYFARDAAYSARNTYSTPDSSGVQRMFLCRVVVGSYCKGIKDALAPDARDGKGGTLLHDTTVDAVKDPSIFVTYHDAQAYPDYLVYFKTTA